MNEVFDIRRLGKLLQYEAVNYIPRFFRTLLIVASVIVAVWLLSFTLSFEILADDRSALVKSLFTLAVTISPFIVYKDMNNRKKGYIYAMIPASTLEKLLSMLVISIVVVPVIAYAVLTATDLLVFMLSKIGLGYLYKFALYNPFADSLGTMQLVNNNMGIDEIPLYDILLSFVTPIIGSIMFNAVFRKNKVLKTILFLISVFFFFVILVTFMVNNMPQLWENLYDFFTPRFKDMEPGEVISACLVLGRIWNMILITLFLTITYFRIKRVNY